MQTTARKAEQGAYYYMMFTPKKDKWKVKMMIIIFFKALPI